MNDEREERKHEMSKSCKQRLNAEAQSRRGAEKNFNLLSATLRLCASAFNLCWHTLIASIDLILSL